MDQPGGPQFPEPPVPAIEYCYRHPTEATRVHCTRCGRPICPQCMIPAPVGHQCPECVQQARREFQQGPGQRVRSATGGLSATKVLLGAMVIGYVLEVVAGGSNALMGGPSISRLVDLGALVPAITTRSGQLIGGIAGGETWRFLTSIFLHAGLLHIAFNAWALWIFGTAMENVLGTPRFLVVFFVTGFLAGVTSYALGPIDVAGRVGPNEYVIGEVAIGASGAIFGIFGAFVAYNFRRRHLASAAANLRLAMTLILLNAMLAFAFGTIDWRAHVGGFVSGLAAGFIAEGFGSRAQRTAIAVAGFAALIAIGVVATMHRTAEIRALLGL
jgi:membrane associated rhomboid family serine protease